MKIQFLSDTHGYSYFNLNPEADLIVHGGDADDGIKGLLEFANSCEKENRPYLIVPGNHDYWTHNIEDIYKYFNENNIPYLSPDKIYEQDGITFVGGTLFSNFRSNRVDAWDTDKFKESCRSFRDFSKIYSDNTLVKPSDFITMFNQTFNNIIKYRDKDNVVVITHFPPKPDCSHPIFDREASNSAYFTNDVDIAGFKTWLFAHTHYNIDETIQGCRLVSNALGYPGEILGAAYNNSLLIEV